MSTSIKPPDLNWALNAALPPLDFVLPGLEPEMFGLIVAPGGTGKTFFGLDLVVSVAPGRKAPMDIQHLFQERLPHRPYCTNDCGCDPLIRPKTIALRYRHIQPPPPPKTCLASF